MSIWLSPSQINTFRQCQRKWAWRHLDRIDTPSNAAAQEGLAGHEILETYFKTAKLVVPQDKPGISGHNLVDLVSTGLHHYPAPGTAGLQVEHHFGVMIGGYHFHGYKDLQLLSRKASNCVGCSGLVDRLCPNCMPQIWDHKFTSNISGHWVKRDNDLMTDTQSVIYALDAMLASGHPEARCNWIYYQRRGTRRNQKAQAILKASEIIEPIKAIVGTAAEIHEVKANATTATQLPPSVDQCTAYGGCVYRSRCNLSSSDVFTSIMNSNAAREVFYNPHFLER